MKFRVYGMVLSLFLVLGLVFSGVHVFAGHGDGMGKKAEDVDPTMMADVSEFLDHILEYYNQTVERADEDALSREITIYGMEIRRKGTYNDGEDAYSMGINENNIITNHAKYPRLLGWEFNPEAANSSVADTIKDLTENSEYHKSTPELVVERSMGSITPKDENHCVKYGGEANKYACAAKVWSPSGAVSTIAGLDHEKNDPAFEEPDCSDFTLETSAEDVFNDPDDDEKLKAYVEGAVKAAQKLVAKATGEQLSEFTMNGGNLVDLAPGSPGARQFGIGVANRIFGKIYCFASGDLSHKNIYSFIMDAEPENPTVLINGNDPDLNGSSLDLNDDRLSGEQNIAKLFSQKLGDLKAGADAYVTYHWDDPETEEDNVPNFFRDRKVPGTSCKRSYLRVININELVKPMPPGPPDLYIVGSGTYPGNATCEKDDDDGEKDDDDGGCAIAGAGHTPQGTLLNLFITASLLFSVVFLRRRA